MTAGAHTASGARRPATDRPAAARLPAGSCSAASAAPGPAASAVHAHSVSNASARPDRGPSPIVPITVQGTAMGGRFVLHLDGEEALARRDAQRILKRVHRWSDRLTRHASWSELIALNADPHSSVEVGPTLAGALRAGRRAGEAGGGLVDITLLDARLAAEGLPAENRWNDGPRGPYPRGDGGVDASVGQATRTGTALGGGPRPSWSMADGRRGTATVKRPAGLRFDLGGVGKGWIADRALNLLAQYPSAVVDADGDLAVRCAAGRQWSIAVDDPRNPGTALAILRLTAPTARMATRWGVATSGISIHRWSGDGVLRHHLIDPRTGAPAVTDVVQATVVAGTTLRAEALAKAAVIAGLHDGFALLGRAGVHGAVVLTDRGETLALPSTLSLLGD